MIFQTDIKLSVNEGAEHQNLMGIYLQKLWNNLLENEVYENIIVASYHNFSPFSSFLCIFPFRWRKFGKEEGCIPS